jgi:hypothetical protein
LLSSACPVVLSLVSFLIDIFLYLTKDVHHQMKGQTKCDMCLQCNIIQP